ncbi:putative manganese-dependent inorganic pyrophosphatase [Variovorax sp. PBS-H4]|uniref:CBS domain-containing protein n=1 Tax=Variovorax sp. PBS-H4 TaxID=434008 RepID=UPI0013197B5A|nr:CBS domain-containing protein [Variovorax sp. PBS-H4]VTU36349.1 putative manganese-dependent inorganic pyrophosphatase [Variovorax sp. PBS-H4]
MSQPISSLMQRPVSSVTMEDSVAQVEALLAGRRLSWVPVLEPARGEVAGVISASDLVAFHGQGRDPVATHAWQMCSYKPIVVDVATSLAQVAALMVERSVHHVVVTDGDGIAGVVSSLDFVRTFARSA